MKQFCKKAILCHLFGLVFSLSIEADEYKVCAVSSDRILIGNKFAQKGMKFTDNDKIVWPKNDPTACMRLRNLTKHCWQYRPPRPKVKSSGEILGSKGSGQENKDTLPMIDSLIFDLNKTDYGSKRFEARWIDEKYKEKKAILSRSKDGSSVCLTREMLGLSVGQICEIEIYAYKPDDDDVLWKVITVEVVPLTTLE